jgi:Type II CAAX prenyl endopeptidase Rce1-like
MNQVLRLCVASAVVGIWMALGWLLHLDANSYLLVGVPLLVLFQLFVARRPLTELWLKKTGPEFFSWRGLLAAIPFLLFPAWDLATSWKIAALPIRLWLIAAIVGAIPLGATLVRARLQTWNSLLYCLLTAGILGSALMVLTSMAIHHGHHPPRNAWQIGARSFLLYLPVCFVIEEVFFRGGIDSYVQRDGDRFGWLTAIAVSCLWGWWHMPIFPAKSAIEIVGLAISCPLITCVTGIPFSLFWRRSGSLLVTATVHALVDAIRNAIM